MDERTLARTVEILQGEPAPYLAVDQLWERLRQEGLLAETSLEDFQRQLASDPRFEFTQGPILPGMSPEESRQTLRALDLVSGPSVKLASRPVTLDALLDGLAHSLHQLEAALEHAWQTRPPGDAQAEQVLRQAMERADVLRSGIERVIAAHRPPSPKDQPP
ncbi:MAG: hypothetical protein AB1449_07905 [Chloroflexota bacterium]